MRIEYQLTFEDFQEYKEALEARFARKQSKRSLSPQEITWVVLGCAVVGAIVIWLLAADARRAFLTQLTGAGRSTIVDVTLPFMGIWSFIICVKAFRAGRRREERLAQIRRCMRVAGYLLLAVVVIGAWPLLRFFTEATERAPELRSLWPYLFWLLGPHSGWFLIIGIGMAENVRKQEREANRRWDLLKHLHHVNQMEVTNEGLRFEHVSECAEYKWFGFTDVAETPRLLLVHTDDITALPIPKRAFGEGTPIKEFRETLKFNVTNRPVAFPVVPIAGTAKEAQ